jgi:hypothetical protein
MRSLSHDGCTVQYCTCHASMLMLMLLYYLPHEYLRGAEHVPARLPCQGSAVVLQKEFGRCQCSVSPHPSTGSLWT